MHFLSICAERYIKDIRSRSLSTAAFFISFPVIFLSAYTVFKALYLTYAIADAHCDSKLVIEEIAEKSLKYGRSFTVICPDALQIN